MAEPDIDKIHDELSKVEDPELGMSIMELNLIDKVEVKDGDVLVAFRLTSPFCPPMFGMKMAQDVKEFVSRVPGVKSVRVEVIGHYMAEYINKTVNEGMGEGGQGEQQL